MGQWRPRRSGRRTRGFESPHSDCGHGVEALHGWSWPSRFGFDSRWSLYEELSPLLTSTDSRSCSRRPMHRPGAPGSDARLQNGVDGVRLPSWSPRTSPVSRTFSRVAEPGHVRAPCGYRLAAQDRRFSIVVRGFDSPYPRKSIVPTASQRPGSLPGHCCGGIGGRSPPDTSKSQPSSRRRDAERIASGCWGVSGGAAAALPPTVSELECVELADSAGSNPVVLRDVRVRLPPRARTK